MLESEKIKLCRNLINDVSVTDAQISTYLSVSQSRIIRRLYPFEPELPELPSIYDMMQCELAVRMIARRGGEGEIGHSENGVSRSYASVDDEDILSRITPYIKVM
ncbi:MAG: DNA-packaging protein [Clostridiales bacterium]|nr:DNA-packaging protein [Clostridiales bacterium]